MSSTDTAAPAAAEPQSNLPIELRNHCALFTMQHLQAGIQPLRMQRSPQHIPELFAPAQLQWRFRERVRINGAQSIQWSDWHTVPLTLELPLAAAADAAPQG